MPTPRLASNHLRAWRVANDLTLQEMADLTGISVSMLSRVEREQKNFLPLTKVTIARRLGVPVGDLFPVESVSYTD